MTKTIKKVNGKLKQGMGKVRRFTTSHFRKRRVEEKLKLRRGECNRCGACCKLLFKCPYLVEHPDGGTTCKIHVKRPLNCRIFPVDERCLKERNEILPELPCGFYFVDGSEEPGAVLQTEGQEA